MFSGNVYIRGLDELGKIAAEEMLREASQLANLADAKRTSLGVTNFREQFVLSNGATLDVVINEHHSFMNIVGAGEEFEEEVEEEEELENFFFPIYVFQPKSTHPKVVIYADSDAPDGVRMEFGDNIYAGGNYSQYDNGELLLTTEKKFHRPYTDRGEELWKLISNDGTCGATAGEYRAYVKGQTLLKLSNLHIIGAAIVTYEITDGTVVSMYCFVDFNAYFRRVRFYSHPLVDIPEDPADPSDPIIDVADLILAHTITLTTYTEDSYPYNNAEVTTCTFNAEGTSALLVQSGRDQATRGIEQTEYNITLSISDDPIPELVVSESTSTSGKYQTVNRVYIPDPEALPISYTPFTFCNLDSRGAVRCNGYSTSTYEGRFHADTFTGFDTTTTTYSGDEFVSHTAMNSLGTILRCTISKSGSSTHRHVRNILYDGVGHALGAGPGASPSLITSWDQSIASFNSTHAVGIDLDSSSFRYRHTALVSETYTFNASWSVFSVTGVQNIDSHVRAGGYLVQFAPTYTPVRIYLDDPDAPLEGLYPAAAEMNRTETFIEPAIYGNSINTALVTDTNRLQVGVRENMSITLKRIDEFPIRTFTYDVDTRDYVWEAPPEILYKQTLLFESAKGSVPIPGLANDAAGVTNGRTNTLYIDPRDTYNLTWEPPSTYYSWLDNYAPFLTPSVDVPFLPHPKGYCLYSLTDFCIDNVRANFPAPASQSCTVVVGLYIEKTNEFVDILKMYNDMIANDPILSPVLAPVPSELSLSASDIKLYAYGELPYVAQGSLMYYGGLLDEIHEPTIDYSDYTGA
jgi:hypothetical protein